MMNLMNTEFKYAPLIVGILPAEELYYQSMKTGKMQFFKAIKGSEFRGLLAVHIVRRDQNIIWESSRDVIIRAIKDASVQVRGAYVFELLDFEANKELKTFNMNELTQLLVNTSRTLKPGEQALIKYSTVYGILQKCLDEAWGKITFKASVEILPDKPKAFFSLLLGMLKTVEALSFPVNLLVNDLSLSPVFNPSGSEEIQGLLDIFILKRSKIKMLFPRDVYVRDCTGLKSI